MIEKVPNPIEQMYTKFMDIFEFSTLGRLG